MRIATWNVEYAAVPEKNRRQSHPLGGLQWDDSVMFGPRARIACGSAVGVPGQNRAIYEDGALRGSDDRGNGPAHVVDRNLSHDGQSRPKSDPSGAFGALESADRSEHVQGRPRRRRAAIPHVRSVGGRVAKQVRGVPRAGGMWRFSRKAQALEHEPNGLGLRDFSEDTESPTAPGTVEHVRLERTPKQCGPVYAQRRRVEQPTEKTVPVLHGDQVGGG